MKTQGIIRKKRNLKKFKSYVDIHRAMTQMVTNSPFITNLLSPRKELPKEISQLKSMSCETTSKENTKKSKTLTKKKILMMSQSLFYSGI